MELRPFVVAPPNTGGQGLESQVAGVGL